MIFARRNRRAFLRFILCFVGRFRINCKVYIIKIFKTVNYKNNDTVTRNLQRAAKNIIYSVTNSNAVQSYSDTIKSTAKVFPWRALLTVLDVVVWLACAAGIAIPIILYIKGKKQPQQQDNDKTGA